MWKIAIGFLLIVGTLALARYEVRRFKRSPSCAAAERLVDYLTFAHPPIIAELVVVVGLLSIGSFLVYEGVLDLLAG